MCKLGDGWRGPLLRSSELGRDESWRPSSSRAGSSGACVMTLKPGHLRRRMLSGDFIVALRPRPFFVALLGGCSSAGLVGGGRPLTLSVESALKGHGRSMGSSRRSFFSSTGPIGDIDGIRGRAGAAPGGVDGDVRVGSAANEWRCDLSAAIMVQGSWVVGGKRSERCREACVDTE